MLSQSAWTCLHPPRPPGHLNLLTWQTSSDKDWHQHKAAHLIKSRNLQPQVFTFRAESEKEVELLKTSFTNLRVWTSHRCKAIVFLDASVFSRYKDSCFSPVFLTRRLSWFQSDPAPAASDPSARSLSSGWRWEESEHCWASSCCPWLSSPAPGQSQVSLIMPWNKKKGSRQNVFWSPHNLQLVARKPSSSGAKSFNTQQLGVGRSYICSV